MTYLDPQQQLIQARGLMQPQAPNAPMGSSYINEVERQASQTAAGVVNFGTNALMGAPMVASMGFGLMSMAGAKGMLGKVARGGDIGMSMLDPFGAAFEAIPRALAGKTSMMGAGIAVAGAYGTSKVISGTADFIRDSMLEGQRDYLATRTLMRQMPQSGYGPQSVLSMGMQSPGHFGPNQLSQMNAQIRSVANDYNMSMGQARNQLSSLHQMGMIDTSSVQRISQSFRKSLQELKSVAQQIGGDIQEAKSVYQALDQMGFKSSSGRRSMLGSMTTTSALTGMSLGQVGGHMAPVMGMAKNMGLSSETGGNLAMRSLQTTAYMKAAGMVSSQDLADVGGISGYAQKMSAMHLQTLGSRGSTAMMSNIFRSHGGMNIGALGKLMSGDEMRVNYAGLQGMDPYAIGGMQEDMSDLTGAAILARVSSINRKHSGDPLKARQTQFRFLQSMGIGSAKDQMQYLSYLRAQPGSDFAAGLQGLRNNALTSRDGSMNDAGSISGVFEDTINEITRRLKMTFSRAGEALTRDFEDSNRRVSLALSGRRRDYGSGVTDMGAMRAVARDIMHGGSYGALDNRFLEQRLAGSENLRRAMSASVNLSGIDSMTRATLLQGPMDGLAYASARGSRFFGDLLSTSMSGALEKLTGVEGSSEYRRSVGSLGEMISGGLMSGDLQLGMSRRGRRVSASPSDYMGMVGRDLGVELERAHAVNGSPLGMRVVRPDESAISLLMRNRGGAFDRAWNGGIGMNLQRQINGNDTLMSALGAGGVGMAGGFFMGASVGGLLGAGAGGIGAIPGAAIGGVIGAGIGTLGGVSGFTGSKGMGEVSRLVGIAALPGIGSKIGVDDFVGGVVGDAASWWADIGKDALKWTDKKLGTDAVGDLKNGYVGQFLSGGVKGVLDKYSESMGVAGDMQLSPQHRRMLQRNYGQLADAGKFDELASALFSAPNTSSQVAYKGLDSQQRAILREFIRRKGGSIGEALAGPRQGGNLSTEQFNSILSQEMGRNFAGVFFGVGGTAERDLMLRESSQSGGLDITAVGRGLSGEERRRIKSLNMFRGLQVGSVQGRDGTGGKEMVMGGVEAFRQLTQGDFGLSEAFRELRELSGGSEDILNIATVRSGGRMIINERSINNALSHIVATRGDDVTAKDVERIRKTFMERFRAVRKGESSAAQYLANPVSLKAAPDLGLFKGMGGKGFLAEGLLTSDGMRVQDSALGTASGVSAGISNLLEEARGGKASSSSGMDAALLAAIKKTAGQEFFTDKEAVTSLGSLLELSATQAAEADMSPMDTRAKALERLTELEKAGVINENRANLVRANQDLAFGNQRSGSMSQLLGNIGGLSDADIDRYQEQAGGIGDMYRYSARNTFMAARNSQVRNLTQREIGRRSGEFRSLIGALGSSKMGGTGAIAKLETALKGVDGDELQVLRDRGGSMDDNLIRDVISQISGRMTQKGVSDGEKRQLQQIVGQLGTMERLAFGGDDFGALAASATQGAITFGSGGKMEFNRGRLIMGMGNIIGQDRAAAIATQSGSIKGLERLMGGVKDSDERRKLLEQIAGADADTSAGKARQVLGHFGLAQSSMVDADAVKMMDRLVRDTSDVRGNEELKTAFEESLNRVFKTFIGQGDEKKAEKDQSVKAVLQIRDIIKGASILKGDPPTVHVDNMFLDMGT